MRAGHGIATLVLLLVTLTGTDAANGSLSAQTASPRARVPAPSHDFGTVKQGERLTHAFTILNDGTAALTIQRIDLSVWGTKTRFRQTILPGESGQITMEWDTSTVQGEFRAAAVVHVDDPVEKRILLTLRAVVKAPLEFVPFPQVFFSAYRDETPDRTVQILNNDKHPMKITGAESPSGHYDVTVDTVRSGFAYDVRVKVRPGVPFGRYAGEPIYLRTDSPVQPRLELLANLLVKPDFYSGPEDVDFGAVSLEALGNPGVSPLLKQSVVLTNREGAVEIERIESDIPALEITRTPSTGSSQRFRIDFALTPDKAQRGRFAGTVRVVTTNPAIPALAIPVRGEVK